jgi:2-polyprenyl-3-methyl-5-hydroxy-6-metoxy-1,4-benzoquinol methylase
MKNQGEKEISYKEYQYRSIEPGDIRYGPRLADFIIKQIAKLNGIQSICDLGCGNGYLAGRLGALGYSVLGIDASESGIAVAKTRDNNNIGFLCSTFDSELLDNLRSREFDLITSLDVIEHLYRPSDLLNVAHGLLKPGGYLILTTPYHGYMKNLALVFFNKWDAHHGVHWDGGHIKFFSVKTLSRLAEDNGFLVQKFLFLGRVPWLWKSMICIAQKK